MKKDERERLTAGRVLQEREGPVVAQILLAALCVELSAPSPAVGARRVAGLQVLVTVQRHLIVLEYAAPVAAGRPISLANRRLPTLLSPTGD